MREGGGLRRPRGRGETQRAQRPGGTVEALERGQRRVRHQLLARPALAVGDRLPEGERELAARPLEAHSRTPGTRRGGGFGRTPGGARRGGTRSGGARGSRGLGGTGSGGPRGSRGLGGTGTAARAGAEGLAGRGSVGGAVAGVTGRGRHFEQPSRSRPATSAPGAPQCVQRTSQNASADEQPRQRERERSRSPPDLHREHERRDVHEVQPERADLVTRAVLLLDLAPAPRMLRSSALVLRFEQSPAIGRRRLAPALDRLQCVRVVRVDAGELGGERPSRLVHERLAALHRPPLEIGVRRGERLRERGVERDAARIGRRQPRRAGNGVHHSRGQDKPGAGVHPGLLLLVDALGE